MGSAESTGRANATDDDERRTENDSSGGGSGTAIAVAAAGAAVAAWGIRRMLSDSTDTESQEKDDLIKIKAPGMGSYLLNPGTTSYGERESKHPSSRAVTTWPPPPLGRFKMNTDGACRPNPGGPIGYGGILRDCHGQWVQGFRGFIMCESDGLTAEFHGILKGLKLLDKLRLKESILESDCEFAIDWIENRERSDPGSSPIIRDCWRIIMECRRLIDENGIAIHHIDEDANKCADKLAKMALNDKQGYVEIIELPDEIKQYMAIDRESPVF